MEEGEIKAGGGGEGEGAGRRDGRRKGRYEGKEENEEGGKAAERKGGSNPEDRLSPLWAVGDGPSPVGPGCAHLAPWGAGGRGVQSIYREQSKDNETGPLASRTMAPTLALGHTSFPLRFSRSLSSS